MRIIGTGRRTDRWDAYDPSQSVSKGLKQVWAPRRARPMLNANAERLQGQLPETFDPPLCVPA